MKQTAQRLLAVLSTAALLVAALAGVASLTRVKAGMEKNQDFYMQQADFDVLIFGTSHSVLGVLPMELWQRYGIVSYNLGNHGQWPSVDYWVLKNALRHTTPKLVVLESFAVYSTEKYSSDHIGFLHEMIDPMPWSADKLAAVNDLFENPLRKEFLLPFSSYHSRWDVLDESFFQAPVSTLQRGADENGLLHTNADTLVQPDEPTTPLSVEDMNDTRTLGKDYLEKSIALCQENGIDVLLLVTPFAPTDEAQRWANSVYPIARRYGVDYLNGLQLEGIVQLGTDLWDAGHLNSSGANKWTDYLGAYIQAHYDIPDRRNDADYANWRQDYAAYLNERAALLRSESDFYNHLVMLKNPQFDVCISIAEGSAVYGDELACQLIENIVPDGFAQARGAQRAFFGATDRAASEAKLHAADPAALPEGFRSDVEIVAINRLTGERIEHACFSVKPNCRYERYDAPYNGS